MKQNKATGITLIALIITIIVLLILAGVAITTLAGNNGVITKTIKAKDETERSEIIENAKLDIMAMQIDKEGKITITDLKNVLNKFCDEEEVKNITEENAAASVVTTKDKKYEINVSEIYNGGFLATTTDSYVGYYADLNGDKEPDGIIYADRAIEKSGSWSNNLGVYSIQKSNVENLKKYSISKIEDKYNDKKKFGGANMLTAEGTGIEDRFYVMSLSDLELTKSVNGSNTCYWYKNAMGNMSDCLNYTSGDFGAGKENTKKMIARWKANGTVNGSNANYGNGTEEDLWGQIDSKVAEGWFIPSRAEWSAFADAFKIDSNNYSNFGLSNYYWASSQYNTQTAWQVRFYNGDMFIDTVGNINYVRMSMTF